MPMHARRPAARATVARPPGAPAAEDDTDDARRRLYRPGATRADVLRYLAERPGDRRDDPIDESAGPVPRGGLRRRWIPIGLAVAVVGGLVLTDQLHRAPAPPPSTASASGTREDVGDGEAIRVRRDAAGDPAFTAVTGLGAPAAGQRFDGRGSAVVPVADTSVRGSGRASVTLTSDGSFRAEWRALRTVVRPDGGTFRVVLARGPTATGAGPDAASTFVYADQPPGQVAVIAPPGTRWTLVVAVTSGLVSADG